MGEKNIFDKGKSAPNGESAIRVERAERSTPEGTTTKGQHSLLPFVPILPSAALQCPIEHILYGPPVAPEHHIKGYSEDEFENFIREWAFYYKQINQKAYAQVGRFGGAGDMGRDVVAI